MFNIQIDISFGQYWDTIKSFSQISEGKLERIAEAVRAGIEHNISAGLEYTGGSIRDLLPSTVKKKHSARPLVSTGLLMKSIEKRTLGAGEWEIFVNEERSQIAYYLHFGTGNIKRMPFFGVSSEVERDINQILSEENT